MTTPNRPRITRVEVNTKRHLIVYHFSDGREITAYFVGNIRAAWQKPHFQHCHSMWLSANNRTQLLGGVTHDPLARSASRNCYWHMVDGFSADDFFVYITMVVRNAKRTWTTRSDLHWLNVESALYGPMTYVQLWAGRKLSRLPDELVADALPKLP